jgi:hypothetical protein
MQCGWPAVLVSSGIVAPTATDKAGVKKNLEDTMRTCLEKDHDIWS